MYINKVVLYGNLTRDPELRALPNGGQVVSFAIATNRTYKNAAGEKQEEVEYHTISAFGRTAEVIAQYFKKGRPIYVEGRLRTRSWEKEGVKQYRTEVMLENFQFGAEGRSTGATSPSESSQSFGSHESEIEKAPSAGHSKEDAIDYPAEESNPDDIPF